MPYGNAKITADNKTITCQHGAEECLYNTLMSCSIGHYPTSAQWLPYVHCLEVAIDNGSISKAEAKKCAAASNLDWAVLDKCWTGAEGHALDVANAFTTSALQPPHQYVPWVTLDAPGTFCTENGCDNLVQAVCDAYTGPKPDACNAAVDSAVGLRGSVYQTVGCPAKWE